MMLSVVLIPDSALWIVTKLKIRLDSLHYRKIPPTAVLSSDTDRTKTAAHRSTKATLLGVGYMAGFSMLKI